MDEQLLLPQSHPIQRPAVQSSQAAFHQRTQVFSSFLKKGFDTGNHKNSSSFDPNEQDEYFPSTPAPACVIAESMRSTCPTGTNTTIFDRELFNGVRNRMSFIRVFRQAQS